MAKLTSARRDAHQHDHDAPAVHRVTRSQSAEPKSVPPPLARGRAAPTFIDQPATQASDQSEDDTYAVADLTKIEEDEDQITEENVPDYDDEHLEGTPPQENTQVSIMSGFSGTTAKTSFSQEEMMDLDSDLMIDVLPNLVSAAQDLRKTICPSEPEPSPDNWKEIRRVGSKANKVYHSRLAVAELHKPKFGSEAYIQPRNVIRALLGVQAMREVPAAIWRPDNLLFKVNIVQMLNSLLVSCDPSDWTATAIDELERLDVAFPSAIAGSQFDMESIEFYLRLAAQLAVARLEAHVRSEPDFSPLDVVTNLLYDHQDAFKYAHALGLNDLDEEARDQVFVKVSHLDADLKHPFSERNPVNYIAAIGMLKSRYQWTTFIAHALRYATYRTRVIDDRIDAAGGVDRIVDGLDREVQRREAIRASGQTVEKYTKRKSITAAAQLRALEKDVLVNNETTNITARADFPSARQNAEPVEILSPHVAPPMRIPQAKMTFEDDDFRVLEDEADSRQEDLLAAEPEDRADKDAQSTLPIFDAVHAKQREIKHAGKPRSLLDKQQDAVRLDWNEIQSSQNPSPQTTQLPLSRPPKRTLADVNEDVEDPQTFEPTQDEGFQTDSRDIAAANQRRKEVSYDPISSVPHRPSFLDHSVAPPTVESSDEVPVESSPKRRRKNPGSALPPPIQRPDDNQTEPSRSTLLQTAREIAQRNRVMSSQAKPPQERSQWSDEEEERLLHLIEDNCHNGIRWAALKSLDQENGDQLKRRDAESMRQKARNMKTTLLLAGGPLPTNWEKVVLDKKLIDKLHSRGIIYTQAQCRISRSY